MAHELRSFAGARREVMEIPQSGTKHSLNVSVCGGMVLWEAYKAMRGGNRRGAEEG